MTKSEAYRLVKYAKWPPLLFHSQDNGHFQEDTLDKIIEGLMMCDFPYSGKIWNPKYKYTYWYEDGQRPLHMYLGEDA